MMPPAIEPTMPSASTSWRASSLSAAPTPAAAAMAPKIAVGWKPALWTASAPPRSAGTWSRRRPRCRASADGPSGLCRSQAASTAGTMTAPACTGPPSKVSSKSSPCAAVPLTKAAPAALMRARVADRGAGPVVVPAGERGLDVVLVARGDAEADHVDQQVLAFAPHRRRQPRGIERGDLVRENFGDGDLGKFSGHGSGVAQAGVAEAGDAVDGDDDGEGDDEHDRGRAPRWRRGRRTR